jgi:hypothetical protein
VRVDFENPHALPQGTPDPCRLQRGSLWLDSAHHWCIRAGEGEVEYPESKSTLKINTDVIDPNAIYPIPKVANSLEQGTTTSGQKQITKTVAKYDLHVADHERPDSEFYLTGFSLPEPTGIVAPAGSARSAPAQGSHVPWFVWIAAAGLLCLLIGVTLSWRKARAGSSPGRNV